MLAPKSGWLLSMVLLITFLTLKFENRVATYSGRTSLISIDMFRKLAQMKRLDAPTNVDRFICWLRSLIGGSIVFGMTISTLLGTG